MLLTCHASTGPRYSVIKFCLMGNRSLSMTIDRETGPLKIYRRATRTSSRGQLKELESGKVRSTSTTHCSAIV